MTIWGDFLLGDLLLRFFMGLARVAARPCSCVCSLAMDVIFNTKLKHALEHTAKPVFSVPFVVLYKFRDV